MAENTIDKKRDFILPTDSSQVYIPSFLYVRQIVSVENVKEMGKVRQNPTQIASTVVPLLLSKDENIE
jgi:hypothetical protein